ncbi:hypothetical protein Taro_021050 [Colocasia esculenta]|uniref:Zinc-finger domain-containing protein n=1 Tax=Colocasia esculenta TaxID=4460 RepID=A0A843V734_COLES|nr:hypothetical protein [Colocasia esculenta]
MDSSYVAAAAVEGEGGRRGAARGVWKGEAMVSTRAPTGPPGRGGALPAEATTPPPPSLATRLGDADVDGSGGTQEYERRRDERIRENMERMQRLGIVGLALKFRTSISGGSSARKRAYSKTATATPSPDLPPRRSSRLQNVTPVSYSEIRVAHQDEIRQDEAPLKKIRIEGPVEEVYTDEHEKLLGTCETGWTLFVDGYSEHGGRIYDPVKGKTCHQCRQKTLGHRTSCSKCKIVQGQFCGDCLYMRYGENVLEANKNPNWICPVCRGICNCSLCRTKKGWAPTGVLYKKILRLGFKSVAHFLIQTKRAHTSTEGLESSRPISAKRSLPFSDEVGALQISSRDKNDDHCNQQMILFDKDNDTECSRDGSAQKFDECGKFSILDTSKMSRKKQKKVTESTLVVKPSTEVAERLKNHKEMFRHSASNNRGDNSDSQIILLGLGNDTQLFCNQGKDAECIGNEEVENSDKHDDNPTLERAGETRKKHQAKLQSVKPNSDSIGGRFRSRGIEYKGSQSSGEKETQGPDEYIRKTTLESSKEKDLDIVTVPSLGCTTGSQRTQSIYEDSGCKGRKDNIIGSNSIYEDSGFKSRKNNIIRSNTKLGNKDNSGNDLALLVQPSIDCIAGRLRSRSSSYDNSDKGTQSIIVSNNVAALESNGRPRNRKELALIVIPTPDSIAGRLRSRNKNGGYNRLRSHSSSYDSDKGTQSIIVSNNVAALESNGKPRNRKELALIVIPTPDSIAGRLRSRNKNGGYNRLRSHSSSYDSDKGRQYNRVQ